jgi:hypothetical protein
MVYKIKIKSTFVSLGTFLRFSRYFKFLFTVRQEYVNFIIKLSL